MVHERNKMTKTNNLFRRNRSYMSVALSIAVAIFLVANKVSPISAAANAQLYLTPASQSVQAGSNLTLTIMLDTGGSSTSTNAIQTTVNFPANFSYVSITPDSAFTIPFVPTPGSGTINFIAGSGSTPISGVHAVATLVLHAESAGNASITFSAICGQSITATCSAVVDNSSHINDLANVVGGTYTVTGSTSGGGGSSGGGSSGGGSSGGSTSGSSSSSASSKSTAKPPASSSNKTPTSTPATATPGAPNISAISVTNISDTSATVKWHTDVPATSIVNFGLSTQYIFMAQTPGLTTDHSVVLGPPDVVKGTKYYFTVTSANANGDSATSASQQFSTTGFEVTIIVQNKDGKPIKNAKVTLDNKTATTNQQGKVVFEGIFAGKQQVTINAGGKITNQSIQVGKYDPNTKDYQEQLFKLTVVTSSSSAKTVAIGLIVILLVALILIFWKLPPNLHSKKSDNPLNAGPANPSDAKPSSSNQPSSAEGSRFWQQIVSPQANVNSSSSQQSPKNQQSQSSINVSSPDHKINV